MCLSFIWHYCPVIYTCNFDSLASFKYTLIKLESADRNARTVRHLKGLQIDHTYFLLYLCEQLVLLYFQSLVKIPKSDYIFTVSSKWPNNAIYIFWLDASTSTKGCVIAINNANFDLDEETIICVRSILPLQHYFYTPFVTFYTFFNNHVDIQWFSIQH